MGHGERRVYRQGKMGGEGLASLPPPEVSRVLSSCRSLLKAWPFRSGPALLAQGTHCTTQLQFPADMNTKSSRVRPTRYRKSFITFIDMPRWHYRDGECFSAKFHLWWLKFVFSKYKNNSNSTIRESLYQVKHNQMNALSWTGLTWQFATKT